MCTKRENLVKINEEPASRKRLKKRQVLWYWFFLCYGSLKIKGRRKDKLPDQSLLVFTQQHTIMVQVFSDFDNSWTQEDYDKLIEQLELHRLECPCGMCGSLVYHGYYIRHLKTADGKIPIEITRI